MNFGSFKLSTVLAVFVAQGCATASKHYGEVEIQRGSSVRSLGSRELLRKSAAGVALIRTDIGQGMGFVIDPDGYLITNRHVIEDADHVERVSLPAADPPLVFESVQIVYTDPVRDLALLKVKTRDKLPYLPLATRGVVPADEYLRPADPVLLLQRSVPVTTDVHLQHETLLAQAGAVQQLNVYHPAAGPTRYVGVTTKVREGQSGGPVVDRFGRAVGVVTWTWRSHGGGFAIPISDANRMLAERPELETAVQRDRRASERAAAFLNALRSGEVTAARRMMSPTFAKETREQTLLQLFGGSDERRMAMLEGFVTTLEGITAEVRASNTEEGLARVRDLIWRTGTSEFREALGVEHTLDRDVVVSFFYEFAHAYVAARLFGDQQPPEAIEAAAQRMSTVDAARTFALARLLPILSDAEVTVESISAVPGAYGPRAKVSLNVVSRETKSVSVKDGAPQRVGVQLEPHGRRVTLHLRLEWGDWYVAEVASDTLAGVQAG